MKISVNRVVHQQNLKDNIRETSLYPDSTVIDRSVRIC
jgi:hypothetical protein